MTEAPDKARAKVPIEISALQRRHCGSSIDIPTSHCTSSVVMRIVEYWQSKVAEIAIGSGIEAEKPFHQSPSIVERSPCVRGERDIYFFPCPFPDITDIQIIGYSIEGEPPGVAEPQAPDFGGWGERVVERETRDTGSAERGIDTQEFSEPVVVVHSLPIVVRVAATPSITDAGIETAIRTKRQHPPVVV